MYGKTEKAISDRIVMKFFHRDKNEGREGARVRVWVAETNAKANSALYGKYI